MANKQNDPGTGQTSASMEKWARLVARVRADEKLKQRLLADPTTVLQENGLDVPDGVEVRIVENTDTVRYLTLPAANTDRDPTRLTHQQMEAVAGGWVETEGWDEVPLGLRALKKQKKEI